MLLDGLLVCMTLGVLVTGEIVGTSFAQILQTLALLKPRLRLLIDVLIYVLLRADAQHLTFRNRLADSLLGLLYLFVTRTSKAAMVKMLVFMAGQAAFI